MRSREATLESHVFGEHLADFRPIIRPEGSDSSALDNLVDFLIAGGRSLAHVMMMLIPEAIGDGAPRPPAVTGFYSYHSSLSEPWDGPAAVLFTDGKMLGGILDRNGLRPAKYVVTKSGYVVLASEYGVLDFADDDIEERGRLTPGGMFAVDLETKRILHDAEIKAAVAAQQPYGQWVAEQRVQLGGWDAKDRSPLAHDAYELARVFGITREDLRSVIVPMAEAGMEPTGSMGTDTPLAVLSLQPVHFARYFKQQFAEVTNPPIDPVRESLVMTLRTRLGRQKNLLGETPEHCHSIEIEHPIVSASFVQLVLSHSLEDFAAVQLNATFERPDASSADYYDTEAANACGEALAAALHRLEIEAAAAVEQGRLDPGLVGSGSARCRAAPDSDAARSQCSAQPSDRAWLAHQRVAGGAHGLRARGPRPCTLHRIWRQRDLPAAGSRARLARGRAHRGRSRSRPRPLRHGAEKRPAQGHVEDGHQQRAQLSRRPDLRSHRHRQERVRAVSRQGRVEPVRHRAARDRRRGLPARRSRRPASAPTPPPTTTRSYPRAVCTPGALAARSTCGRPRRSRSCAPPCS